MAERRHCERPGGRGTEPSHQAPARARPPSKWYLLCGAALAAWIVGLLAGSYWSGPGASGDQSAGPGYSYPEVQFPPGLEPEYRASLEELQEAVCGLAASFPDSPGSAMAMAQLHYLAHSSAGEVACWERCLQLDPGSRQAYDRLGTLAMESGQYERAVALMRKAVAADPDYPLFHNLLASALMHLGRLEEAVKVLQSHLRINPGSAPSHYLLGQTRLRLKEDEKAKQHFLTAIRLSPAHPRAYHGLVTACTRLGNEEEAAAYGEKFESLQAKDEEARERHDFGEYRDEVFLPKRMAEVMTVVGTTYMVQGEPEQAEKHLLRAAAINPASVQCRKALAALYDQQGQLSEALRFTRELLRLEPYNPMHYRSTGVLYARLNRFEEAEQAFLTVCTLAPRKALGYLALAELYLRANRKLAEAKRLALTAVGIEPAARSYVVLAAVCESSGDLAGARTALEQAVALDPDNPRYRQMYELLGKNR